MWIMVRGLSPNHRNGERHTAWTFCPIRETSGTCHATKTGSPTILLITQFASEIVLIIFINQGCERPSSGFKRLLTTDIAQCIRWIYALSWHINGGTNSTYFWDDNSLSSGQQPAEDCVTRVWYVTVGLLYKFQTTSYRPLLTHICRRVRSYSLILHKRWKW